jgi:ethanolamine ammonia-lyase small subunit
MAEKLPGLDHHLATLKASTPARIFLPSAGAALATKANLAFQLAHAQARDAVGDRLDTGALALGFGRGDWRRCALRALRRTGAPI